MSHYQNTGENHNIKIANPLKMWESQNSGNDIHKSKFQS